LDQWESFPGKTGLSRETFSAIRQTTVALRELALYLLDAKGLSFVLLGRINSDIIERRFGRYRQLAGANYFLSVRQFLEAEKKIRIKCLVKFDKMALKDITKMFGASSETTETEIQSSSSLLLGVLTIDNLSRGFNADGAEGVVFYIAGYIARSLLKKEKCDSCFGLLARSRDAPEITAEDIDASGKSDLIKAVDRGGLVTPSDLVYIVCGHSLEL
jgi:hypothetical protein